MTLDVLRVGNLKKLPFPGLNMVTTPSLDMVPTILASIITFNVFYLRSFAKRDTIALQTTIVVSHHISSMLSVQT